MMLCDKCKKNEANVRVSKYMNGAVYEQNLCSECAGMEANNLFGDLSGFGNMFEGMREMAMMGAMRGNTPGIQQGGNTDFEALGLKLPEIGEAGQTAGAKQGQPKETETLEALNVQLKEAVDAQEFEKAAELRDKIYILEKEMEGK